MDGIRSIVQCELATIKKVTLAKKGISLVSEDYQNLGVMTAVSDEEYRLYKHFIPGDTIMTQCEELVRNYTDQNVTNDTNREEFVQQRSIVLLRNIFKILYF